MGAELPFRRRQLTNAIGVSRASNWDAFVRYRPYSTNRTTKQLELAVRSVTGSVDEASQKNCPFGVRKFLKQCEVGFERYFHGSGENGLASTRSTRKMTAS